MEVSVIFYEFLVTGMLTVASAANFGQSPPQQLSFNVFNPNALTPANVLQPPLFKPYKESLTAPPLITPSKLQFFDTINKFDKRNERQNQGQKNKNCDVQKAPNIPPQSFDDGGKYTVKYSSVEAINNELMEQRQLSTTEAPYTWDYTTGTTDQYETTTFEDGIELRVGDSLAASLLG